MKNFMRYIFATLASLPGVIALYIVLNPPQCPMDYTQEQVDVSRCIIGANIGGFPLFIACAIGIWFAALWAVKQVIARQKPKKL